MTKKKLNSKKDDNSIKGEIQEEKGINSIWFIFGFVFIMILIIGFFLIPKNENNNEEKVFAEINFPETPKTSNGVFSLEQYEDNLRSGGPPPDGIPPVDEPKYVSILEGSAFMESGDQVFVVENNGEVKIFPQKILVWHEIVNDDIGGESLSITYCPLTGSAIGYKQQYGEISTTYGTSGKLLNSNLVMYDRETESYIPQILGTAINNDKKGEDLNWFEVVWTDWDLAITKFPDALVLSRETGFTRNYNRDPYGDYKDEDRNYYNSDGVLFPVMNANNLLPDKEVVIGVKDGDKYLAIQKSKLIEEKVANLLIGDKPIVAIYDESLNHVRVFSRSSDGETLEFRLEEGIIFDDKFNSKWDVEGNSIDTEEQLEKEVFFDVMWFAWIAYFPESETYVN